eukprot:UN05204
MSANLAIFKRTMITSMLNSLDIYRYIWIHYLLTIGKHSKEIIRTVNIITYVIYSINTKQRMI